MTPTANRLNWIDNARGLAIICVILGHFDVYKDLTNIIYTFHMPLFFIVSGCFLTKNIQSTSLKTFLRKKIKRLIIPYIFFSVLLVVSYKILSLFTDIISNNGYINYVDSLINIFIELKRANLVRCHLWFLPCLFISNTIVWIINKYIQQKFRLISILIILFSGFTYNFYTRHTTIWFIDVAMIACFYVFIGSE